MYTTLLHEQQLTPQQQEFLEQYQVESLINGEISASYELWECVNEASEAYLGFDRDTCKFVPHLFETIDIYGFQNLTFLQVLYVC